MGKAVKELISAADISVKLDELAGAITRDYAGKVLTMVCVLKGGVIFMVDLARRIGSEVTVIFDFMDISSYGSSSESSGLVKINKDLDAPLKGKDVLLVEDIIDSGRTLHHLYKYLNLQEPKTLRVCTLLDKPDRRVMFGLIPDYTGFVIPNEFVVGYGLDYNQRYRNLSYIGTLINKNESEDDLN